MHPQFLQKVHLFTALTCLVCGDRILQRLGCCCTLTAPRHSGSKAGLLAGRSRQTRGLCGAQVRSLSVTRGSRGCGRLQHPSFSASFDLFWSRDSFPKLQLTGPHLILPASPSCPSPHSAASVPRRPPSVLQMLFCASWPLPCSILYLAYSYASWLRPLCFWISVLPETRPKLHSPLPCALM